MKTRTFSALSKLAAASLLSLTLANPAAFAQADDRPERPSAFGRAPDHIIHMVEELSLTEAQVELLKATFSRQRESTSQIRELRKRLNDTSFSSTYSEGSAREIAQQIATLSQTNEVAKANARNQFYLSLSDDQKADLSQFMSERKPRKHHKQRDMRQR